MITKAERQAASARGLDRQRERERIQEETNRREHEEKVQAIRDAVTVGQLRDAVLRWIGEY